MFKRVKEFFVEKYLFYARENIDLIFYDYISDDFISKTALERLKRYFGIDDLKTYILSKCDEIQCEYSDLRCLRLLGSIR